MTKIADDYPAIARAQKALEAKPVGAQCLMSTRACHLGGPCHQECIDRPQWLVDAWEKTRVLSAGWFKPVDLRFVPHDPVVPPCEPAERSRADAEGVKPCDSGE